MRLGAANLYRAPGYFPPNLSSGSLLDLSGHVRAYRSTCSLPNGLN